MICEYDVAVTMRDGVKLYVDIFRPKADGNYPVVLAWAPYGKHAGAQDYYATLKGCGQSKALHSEYARFEGPDPANWCPYGYVIIYVDPRGAWGSEGDLTFMSPQEALDGYDMVEWAGTQAWSNGKVGMNGVSYLGWSQWKIAAMNPPHLAAINPWEGVSDFYRELCFHGGIRSNFTAMFPGTMCRARLFSTSRPCRCLRRAVRWRSRRIAAGSRRASAAPSCPCRPCRRSGGASSSSARCASGEP